MQPIDESEYRDWLDDVAPMVRKMGESPLTVAEKCVVDVEKVQDDQMAVLFAADPYHRDRLWPCDVLMASERDPLPPEGEVDYRGTAVAVLAQDLRLVVDDVQEDGDE